MIYLLGANLLIFSVPLPLLGANLLIFSVPLQLLGLVIRQVAMNAGDQT